MWHLFTIAVNCKTFKEVLFFLETVTMSSLLKKLNKIPTKTKNTVNGWVREAERQLTLSNIPSMITGICILFYADNDKFIRDEDILQKHFMNQQFVKYVAETSDLAFSFEGQRVTKLTLHGIRKASGQNKIYTNMGRIFRWRLSFNNPSSISVSSFARDPLFYKYCSSGKLETNFDFRNNQTVWIAFKNEKGKMNVTLDTANKKLTFKIDGKPEISFNIKTGADIQYKLVVALRDKNAYVQIDNCEAL